MMNLGLYSIQGTRDLISAASESNIRLFKGAALLFPKILLYAGKSSVSTLVEVLGQGFTDKQKHSLRSFLISIEEHDQRGATLELTTVSLTEELIDWASVSMEGINAEALRAFVAEHISTYMDAGTSAAEVIEGKISEEELAARESQRLKLLDPMLAFYTSVLFGAPYHDETEQANKMVEVFNKPESEVTSNRELTVTLPNLDDLPLERILELRENPYISKYRGFITNHIVAGTDALQIKDEINEALWDVLAKTKPSPTGSVISRAVAQIPLPLGIPNPLSVARDIKDGLNERRLYTNYGWLYFMQEAKKMT
jgi:hypothetical protein